MSLFIAKTSITRVVKSKRVNHKAGDEFEATAKEAKELINSGAAEEVIEEAEIEEIEEIEEVDTEEVEESPDA